MRHNHIPKAQLIAAAESYAHVSQFADACYRYYYYQDDASRTLLSARLAHELGDYLSAIPNKYHDVLVNTVLMELSYPIPIGKRHAFSERERTIVAKIARQTWRNHGMTQACDEIISHITGIAHVVASKVRIQLGKNFAIGY